MTKKEVNKLLKWFEKLDDKDYIHPKTKEELFKLEELYISNLKYKIPKEISKLKKIRKLVIGFYGIDGEIPKEIKYFKYLKELQLGITQITKINTNLYKLKKLKILSLSGNSFEFLPKGISVLKNLNELDLTFYSESLPKDIIKLKNLRKFTYSTIHLTNEQREWIKGIECVKPVLPKKTHGI